MRAVLNFARLRDDLALELTAGLAAAGITVVGIASHRGEDPARFGRAVRAEWWHDYRPETLARTWPDRSIEDLLSCEELTKWLPLVERASPRTSGSAEALLRIKSDFSRALEFLEYCDPDIVLSLDPPESGLSLMLHRFAAEQEVPQLWLRSGIAGLTLLASTDPFAPVLDGSQAVSSGVVNLGGVSDPAASGRVRAALEAMTAGADPGVDAAQMDLIPPRSGVQQMLHRLARRSPRYVRWRRSRPLLGGGAFLTELREALGANARTFQWGTDRPVCLLALHYQPELTTLTLGGWAVRQLESVKVLSEVMPPEWTLLVKEHPATFSKRSKTTSTFRTTDFYSRASAQRSTIVLPLNADVRSHWNEVSVVATATGTIGAEALAVGCPVLHFGLAPYTNFFGTALVDSPDISRLRTVVDDLTRLDRREIAARFMESVSVIGGVSYISASDHPQQARVEAMNLAITRWPVTVRK